MNSPFPSQIDTAVEVAEAKEYANTQLSTTQKVTPCLTLYRGVNKFLSVYFPDGVDRAKQFQETAFLSSVLHADVVRLIMDSTIPLSLVKPTAGVDETTLAILSVFANRHGAYAVPLPYLMHPENTNPIWQDDNITSVTGDFLKENPALLSFASSQFFINDNSLSWRHYLDFLVSKGYNITYHHPFTEQNIGYGLMSVF